MLNAQILMGERLDDPTPVGYLIHEEDVPRAGIHATKIFCVPAGAMDVRGYGWACANKRAVAKDRAALRLIRLSTFRPNSSFDYPTRRRLK